MSLCTSAKRFYNNVLKRLKKSKNMKFEKSIKKNMQGLKYISQVGTVKTLEILNADQTYDKTEQSYFFTIVKNHRSTMASATHNSAVTKNKYNLSL